MIRATYDHFLSYIRNRKKAYQIVFAPSSAHGQEVLSDLARFCRAYETCFDADPRKHAVLEGRREVWLRVQNHLHLTPEQLFALIPGSAQPKGKTDD